ncbi:MAG: LacI family DNA-binding transcriptional regulator [Eubacteriales bacterium]|nr:LacI family DNA-binding transcriptional regulator [Eubacteriales bacterium]
MAATIHDVARLAGVNSSTVSRLLNGKASITGETKEKIYAAIKELDYHPSSVARSLASGLSGAIGVVVDAEDADAFSNVFFSRSLFAIEQVAQQRGYNVIITNGGKHTAAAVETLMLERKVDGLILPPSTLRPALLEKIGDFPYVVLGQPDKAKKDANWVDNNNEQGAELAVSHLVKMGYQTIVYLGGDQKVGFVKRRVRGYEKALPPKAKTVVLPTDGTPEDAFQTATQTLKGLQGTVGMVCNDNLTAFGLLNAAKKMGLQVPAQLGVVTFDNYPLAEYMDPALTAVDVDTAQLGEQSAQLLFQRIVRRDGANQQILLSTSLIARESTNRK